MALFTRRERDIFFHCNRRGKEPAEVYTSEALRFYRLWGGDSEVDLKIVSVYDFFGQIYRIVISKGK